MIWRPKLGPISLIGRARLGVLSKHRHVALPYVHVRCFGHDRVCSLVWSLSNKIEVGMGGPDVQLVMAATSAVAN